VTRARTFVNTKFHDRTVFVKAGGERRKILEENQPPTLQWCSTAQPNLIALATYVPPAASLLAACLTNAVLQPQTLVNKNLNTRKVFCARSFGNSQKSIICVMASMLAHPTDTPWNGSGHTSVFTII
jgi:hypothetical protein